MGSATNRAKANHAYLFINGNEQVDESHYHTYSESTRIISTGGREVTIKAFQGNTIELRATDMNGSYNNIFYCAEYVSKV